MQHPLKKKILLQAVLLSHIIFSVPVLAASDIFAISAIIQEVNIDSLAKTVRQLSGEEPIWLNGQSVTIMTRYSYSPDIDTARDYLISKLQMLGYVVELQPVPIYNNSNSQYAWEASREGPIDAFPGFSNQLLSIEGFEYPQTQFQIDTLENIIAAREGTIYWDRHFILCAHYDSRADTRTESMIRAPGADDNASGTAAVIEAARVLAGLDFHYSIKFVLFPGEEQGLYGSREYAAAAQFRNEMIEGVINLDMIGYDDNEGTPDGVCEIHCGFLTESQDIGAQMAINADDWNLSLTPELFTGSNSSIASDHASFWNAGYPAVFLFEDNEDFNPAYHDTADRIDKMNLSYFHHMAQLAIGSFARFAETDSTTVVADYSQPVPGECSLHAPYPNPFNADVHIAYELNGPQTIVIGIYDLMGRLVKKLSETEKPAGYHQAVWDGTTESNQQAASGIFFVRLSSPYQTWHKKIVLVR